MKSSLANRILTTAILLVLFGACRSSKWIGCPGSLGDIDELEFVEPVTCSHLNREIYLVADPHIISAVDSQQNSVSPQSNP